MTETVTPQREYGSQSGMGIIGWAMAVGIALILFPLLPLLLILILVSRFVGGNERAS